MARSFKKNPRLSTPGMGDWKRDANRSFRRISHHMLNRVANGDDDALDEIPSDLDEISDTWASPIENEIPEHVKPHKMKGK